MGPRAGLDVSEKRKSLFSPCFSLCLLLPIKVKVKFALTQATKALGGSKDIAVHFLSLGARWGW